MRVSPFRRRLLLATAAAVLAAAVPALLAQAIAPDERTMALRAFDDRMQAYAALHRRLEGPLPPLTTHRDMIRNYVSRQLLANAIRKARAGARQGDIFSPDVARVFRAEIAAALQGRDVEAILADLQEEIEHPERLRPVVNEPLPPDATHEFPAVLLRALPPLPEDLEYRIVGRAVAVWDIHANLIVDFLPEAFRPVELTLRRERVNPLRTASSSPPPRGGAAAP